MGERYGLMVLMKQGRVIDFTRNRRAAARLPTSITVRGEGGKHQLAAYPYQVVIEERCSCA